MSPTPHPALASALLALTPQSGFFATEIPGVTLMRADRSLPPAPVLQEPSIVVLGQGMKRGYLGDEVMDYRPGQCLVVGLPMHFHCDTVVDDGGPMLALTVTVDMAIAGELLSKMKPPHATTHASTQRGMDVAKLDEATLGTVTRLLAALASPEDAKILGPQLVRELHYRILKGPGGDILRAVVAWQGKLGAIYRACERIRVEYAQDLDIATLAGDAAMSPSAFHQAFKTSTGYSPIQYIKATRLQRAHDLIQVSQKGVAQAAYDVGYASASQFSREFKRMFGYSPADAGKQCRECA